jgi:hypothetical protein
MPSGRGWGNSSVAYARAPGFQEGVYIESDHGTV